MSPDGGEWLPGFARWAIGAPRRRIGTGTSRMFTSAQEGWLTTALLGADSFHSRS